MRPRILLAVAALLIVADGHSATLPTTHPQVTQAAPSVTGLAVPDFVAVTINLRLDLTGLNPLVTTGGLDCWGLAIGDVDPVKSADRQQDAQTLMQNLRNLLDNAHGDPAENARLLQDFGQGRADLSRMVGHPDLDVPGYYGSHANVSFPVTNGAYHGTQSVSFRISRVELTDPTTHATCAAPRSFVSCWLLLNGRQALIGPSRQLPDANNVHFVAPGSAINYMAMTPIPGL